MRDKKVKDKHIRLNSPDTYLAVVIYYQDKPSRDGDVPQQQTFGTLTEAKKWLARFPRDLWDGYDKDDFRYREIDERGKYVKKEDPRDSEERRFAREIGLAGRTLVGSMRGTR